MSSSSNLQDLNKQISNLHAENKVIEAAISRLDHQPISDEATNLPNLCADAAARDRIVTRLGREITDHKALEKAQSEINKEVTQKREQISAAGGAEIGQQQQQQQQQQ
jgi:hypothetical protein